MISLFITPDYLRKLYENGKINDEYVLVDIRDRRDFNRGHLNHAVNIDYDNKGNLPYILNGYKNKKIILYCDTGTRSVYAAREMRRYGFLACSLTGGYQNYKR